jgi:poly(3-hydroxybutyrate) depolymerase
MKHLLHYTTTALVALCLFSLQANTQVTIPVGTTTRSMIVYVPTALPSNRPLVISMHGSGQSADYQRAQAKWEQVADTAKFLVVFPSGINNQWDISGTSDINFITAIIDTMQRRYGIDRNRVYLSGFSMGGMMTYHAATQIANKIAAFAPVSGYPLWGSNYNSSRPIPIIHVHGDADDVVTYNNLGNYLNGWITRDQCPTTPQIIQPYPANKPNSIATRRYWGPGAERSEVVLLTLAGKGHWYSLDTANGVHTSLEIWNFVKRFALSATLQENTTGFCNLNGSIDNNYPGYTGSGFYNTANAVGNGINWSVNFPYAGPKTFTIRYASTDSRPARLIVNGTTVLTNISFPATGAWTNWSTITVTANTNVGIASVRLEATGNNGLPNIDYLEVTGGLPAACPASLTTTTTAATNNSANADRSALTIKTGEDPQLSVYPNPATSTVTIKAGAPWKAGDQLTIFNAQGKAMVRHTYKGQAQSINISTLPAGIYLVQVTNTTGQTASQQLIKK